MTVIDPYEAPDNVDPEVVAAVEEAAPEYTDLNLQRRFRVIWWIGIAALMLMGWLLIRAATSGDELDSLRKRNETLTGTIESQQLLIDKLATQLDEAIDQGAVVPEPEAVAAEVPDAEVSPPVGVQGERGDAGAPGETGLPGIEGVGVTGEQGDTGRTGSPGATGETGSSGATGGQGQPGADGSTGASGADGAPGADGTDGVAGADGADGAPGATGPQGPPPSSFTFTIGPTTYTCQPTSSGSTSFDCQPNP